MHDYSQRFLTFLNRNQSIFLDVQTLFRNEFNNEMNLIQILYK